MTTTGILRFALTAVRAHRLRAGLSMLGVAIGIASVILLTALGEGARQYIISQFTQFGSNIIGINPGKVTTMGIPGALGGTTHHLTLEDALALYRVPGVEVVEPFTIGSARVSYQGSGRSVYVYGVTANMPKVWKFKVGQGRFLPEGDPRRGQYVTVLGPTLKRELFREHNPLGRFVKIGGTRFRVIGIMEPKGNMLGFDIDDAAYIPVANGLSMFNLPELVEIDLLFHETLDADLVAARIREKIMERHDGQDDFTITTQTGMLESMDRIMKMITGAVAAIGAISLLVGAIGILSIMWITVNERTGEIGLLKALGAQTWQVTLLFFAESAALSTLGGLLGLGAALGLVAAIRFLIPAMPVSVPYFFVFLALAISILIGIGSGVIPARRAATLDPIEALHAE